MRVLGNIALGFIGALLAIALLSRVDVQIPFRPQPTGGVIQVDMTYVDLLTVMFAGATLVLGALALIVGVVAIFTYQGIKNEAQRTIRTTVDEKMPEVRKEAQQTIQFAVDQRLAALDARIEKEVSEETEERFTRAIGKAGENGDLDKALQRALVAIGVGIGGTIVAEELEKDEDR